jgi:hypothetical protein
MLKYSTFSESKTSSRFLIESSFESKYLLLIESKLTDDIDFNNTYLQENVVELTVARMTSQRETYSKALMYTIGDIFTKLLHRYEDFIVYISIPKQKASTIDNYIEMDKNDDFYYFRIEIDGYVLFFFHNKNKTNGVKVLNSISEFLHESFELTLTLDS